MGKLPEFSPEYQALMQNNSLVLGMNAAGGAPIDPEILAMAQVQDYNQQPGQQNGGASGYGLLPEQQ